MKLPNILWVAMATIAIQSPLAQAGQTTEKKVIVEEEKAPEKGPPLPLHEIEGQGGVFSTLSAYIVNPPRNGEPVGRPALGAGFISLGHGRNLYVATMTWSPWERIELGYGYNWLFLGDLPTDIRSATGVSIGRSSVTVHNFNARFQIIKEGDFGQKWMPALTFGTHYKVNDGISQINKNLGGALSAYGLPGNMGVDFTLYASKMLTFLPRPVLVNVGGRATRAQELGFIGFSDDYSFLFEANVCIFLTDWLILAGEYRQQPNAYTPIPGLIGKSGDWWTVDLGWVVNKNLTIAGGYGYFGTVANHTANGVLGVTVKYEF